MDSALIPPERIRLAVVPARLAIPTLQSGEILIRPLPRYAEKPWQKSRACTGSCKNIITGCCRLTLPDASVDAAVIAQIINGYVRIVERAPRRIGRLIARHAQPSLHFRRNLVLIRPCIISWRRGQHGQNLRSVILRDAAVQPEAAERTS